MWILKFQISSTTNHGFFTQIKVWTAIIYFITITLLIPKESLIKSTYSSTFNARIKVRR